MNQKNGVKRTLKIMTLFMAFLFMWGAIGQLFVHICCEHCHDGFFCEEVISAPEHTEAECHSCTSHDSHDFYSGETPTQHHCACSDSHSFDTEETKLESIIPQIHQQELLLFVCEISQMIPSFCSNTQTQTLQYATLAPTPLDGRDVLLQSQILII